MYWLVFLKFLNKKTSLQQREVFNKTIMKTCYSKTTKRVVSVSWFIFNKALYTPGCQFALISTANIFVPFLSISFFTETVRPCISTNKIFACVSDDDVI